MFKTILLTTVALFAFAANSIFCRVALKGNFIDPAAFTIVRLVSGALILFLLLFISGSLKRKPLDSLSNKWPAALMLFLYAAGFSFAYVFLEAGTGALILFGAVQLTMLGGAIYKGERISPQQWAGIVLALGGFIFLVLPGVKAPPLSGFLLMSIAGAAWGIYSLIGKKSAYPLADTAASFIYTIPAIIILIIIFYADMKSTGTGLLLAFLSGGIASALGYFIWYTALKGITASQASVVQLFVPVIAAFGGVLFLSEEITVRLIVSALMILGGIAFLILKKVRRSTFDVQR